MAWQYIGTANVGPDDDKVTVGPITVPTYAGVQLKLALTTPVPFQFGYCLLSFESSYGRELGTIRVWPRGELTSYYLGAGMTVVDNYGAIVVEPRSWNLRWVKAGFTLSFDVLADLATDLPPDRYTSDGFTTDAGTEIFLVPSGSSGRLQF